MSDQNQNQNQQQDGYQQYYQNYAQQGAYPQQGNYQPVSYTHLDVYKRQGQGNGDVCT